MTDVTAGQNPINSESSEAFARIFAEHSDSITRYIAGRLNVRDWHLAEDLAQDTFLELFRSYTLRDREIDGRVWGLLTLIARRAISHHFRAYSASERPVDTTDWFEARRLPVDHSAEAYALADLTARALLADSPAPLGVAA
ncbi:sigma-70 family RNA polymerase sigma factor [Streptomyces sp. NPDC052287]|uniref:RNA polymerase sigma factor n=1 Tax=Streptomyces sp. NPDC052287 TaxID=3154950 RepID=UPI00343B262D